MRVLSLACLALFFSAVPVDAQDIVAVPIGKQPPGQIPGGGVQVDIQNRTRSLQRVKVRESGGNWYLFTFPPQSGVNLRCASCSEGFEATLPDEPQTKSLLVPGTEYEIRYADDRGHLVLQPRGGKGPR